MNTILLEPTDVLFFRDGRPMSGSLSGHGAAWPLPNVVNHAFHAALHRADFDGVHEHRRGRSGSYEETRDRKFGSLATAGPFPVSREGQWFFPRPADAGALQSTAITLIPAEPSGASSLPAPLRHPVGNTAPPSKEKTAAWWSAEAWKAYLDGKDLTDAAHFRSDSDFSGTESTYGIGIDSETGTVAESQFYSASYLRLKEGWKLGTLACAPDKDYRDEHGGNDLVSALLNGKGGQILVGGQQRVCSAIRDASRNGHLPLPLAPQITGTRVKWVLLTPAIFPQINDHPGGWLPSWIRHADGQVMLKTGGTARQDREGREAWRKRIAALPEIPAKLVAAIVGKPHPVTGWALPNGTDREQGGAKSTHLAVPAGSLYYFECENEDAAQKLAAALNWHGASEISDLKSQIRNRRSTLMGEKGFGLGVCGIWNFHGGLAKK